MQWWNWVVNIRLPLHLSQCYKRKLSQLETDMKWRTWFCLSLINRNESANLSMQQCTKTGWQRQQASLSESADQRQTDKSCDLCILTWMVRPVITWTHSELEAEPVMRHQSRDETEKSDVRSTRVAKCRQKEAQCPTSTLNTKWQAAGQPLCHVL